MQVRMLLGPAGTGKTSVCLGEILRVLERSPEGPQLVLLAPKQTTYQLERKLLASPTLHGYTRLQILSFERFSRLVFDQLGRPLPGMLDEEGRLMVLRGLLARRRSDLKLFRASARLTGFAQELSAVLAEFERHQLSPEILLKLAATVDQKSGLAWKLEDLATIVREYRTWLDARQLQDADRLLSAATQALNEASATRATERPFRIGELWVDGFGEWCPQELEFLAAVIQHSDRATVTFCLEPPSPESSWSSGWSLIQKSFEGCCKRLSLIPGAELITEFLPRKPGQNRFRRGSALEHLERHWSDPLPWPGGGAPEVESLEPTLRLVKAADPEAEAIEAGREILSHVRAGGRFRETAVLVRTLDIYHEPVYRVFSRYGIPFFLDRRESVSHHPLAELSRGALRTVAFKWQWSDWFATLKTGLVPARDEEIDRLENEALARGWQGEVWLKPITIAHDDDLTRFVQQLQQRILPPFHRLAASLASVGNRPNGLQLAAALRALWADLDVPGQLERWASEALSVDEQEHGLPPSAHATVWDQMNQWLQNVELAFPEEPIFIRQWLPILEAGLSSLNVGLIPPALDQVLVGTVDRSRTMDASRVVLMGLNEGVFPAPPKSEVILTETDRAVLEQSGVLLGSSTRQQVSRERYYAYLGLTRARESVLMTYSSRDSSGAPLNPSAFLSNLRQIFPNLRPSSQPSRDAAWHHPTELIPLLIQLGANTDAFDGPGLPPRSESQVTNRLFAHPAVRDLTQELRRFHNPLLGENLPADLVRSLYGRALRTSVSRLEQFAACPFKFFVHSGLRAEERKQFELDAREQGSFQHEVLAQFHEQLRSEGLAWREITPDEARRRVGAIAAGLAATYREGLLDANEHARFMARLLAGSLQDFIETLVTWMREQYLFEPVQVELSFGEEGGAPPWVVSLPNGGELLLHGRIDRVDLSVRRSSEQALCVVVDYKSSQKKLDNILIASGLQLQLLAYLNVLRRWKDPQMAFNTRELIPAGVFYVNLRGLYQREQNRTNALEDPASARKLAFQHRGRFDASTLTQLDCRPGVTKGDQFNFRITKSGELHRGSAEALSRDQFLALLDQVESVIASMGEQIFKGNTSVSPYRKGNLTACDQCSYRSICRMDPWTQPFRVLRAQESEA